LAFFALRLAAKRFKRGMDAHPFPVFFRKPIQDATLPQAFLADFSRFFSLRVICNWITLHLTDSLSP
jgi:hypothetical protein